MSRHESGLYYAVYLFPAALETLGGAIAPYLREGEHGKHLLCAEIDASGSLFEITVPSHDADGKPLDVEVMFPTAMVRLVVSTRPEPELGYT